MIQSPKPNLDFCEINTGVFLCDNHRQVLLWLSQYDVLYENLEALQGGYEYMLPFINYTKGSFEVYFIVNEIIEEEDCMHLLYIPHFLSKKFNLIVFSEKYPQMEIEILFGAMCKQFESIFQFIGSPLPICGCHHIDFIGFICQTDRMMSEN